MRFRGWDISTGRKSFVFFSSFSDGSLEWGVGGIVIGYLPNWLPTFSASCQSLCELSDVSFVLRGKDLRRTALIDQLSCHQHEIATVSILPLRVYLLAMAADSVGLHSNFFRIAKVPGNLRGNRQQEKTIRRTPFTGVSRHTQRFLIHSLNSSLQVFNGTDVWYSGRCGQI